MYQSKHTILISILIPYFNILKAHKAHVSLQLFINLRLYLTLNHNFSYLKLTCHHINRRHICFNIKSTSVHPLLWMNVMLNCICGVVAELLSPGYKRNIQNDNVSLRRESNQRPLSFQSVPLTTRLSGLLMT